MAKEKEFLLTLIVTERVCMPIKAKTLSEAKEKLREAHLSGDVDGIETIDVYEGNVEHFVEPMSGTDYIEMVNYFCKYFKRFLGIDLDKRKKVE